MEAAEHELADLQDWPNTMPLALVRRPGPLLAEGLVTHQKRVPIDVERASLQWSRYVETLRSGGWEIAEVERADDCPDAVFIEDAVVVFDDLAVVARPAAASRQAETAAAEDTARRAGLSISRIDPPATLDGGDVLKVDRSVYVGIGARTTTSAAGQLAVLLSTRGWTVHPVPLRRVLHLKSAVTALPDGTIIGYPPRVDDTSTFDRFMAVPEPEGAHVVLLDNERLLMSSSAPRTITQFARMGYTPIPVDISEFEKLEGCVTCLSVRIRPPLAET